SPPGRGPRDPTPLHRPTQSCSAGRPRRSNRVSDCGLAVRLLQCDADAEGLWMLVRELDLEPGDVEPRLLVGPDHARRDRRGSGAGQGFAELRRISRRSVARAVERCPAATLSLIAHASLLRPLISRRSYASDSGATTTARTASAFAALPRATSASNVSIP